MNVCLFCIPSLPHVGEGNCQDCFGLETVRRPLGSSVMLLCRFGDTSPNSTFNYWVSWSHASSALLTSTGKVLVNLTSIGKIHFQVYSSVDLFDL